MQAYGTDKSTRKPVENQVNTWSAMLERPLIIIFEGTVGAGKTVQAQRLYQTMKRENVDVELNDENFMETPEFRNFMREKSFENAVALQHRIIDERMKQIQPSFVSVKIFVRSPMSGRIFFSDYNDHPRYRIERNRLMTRWIKAAEYFRKAYVVYLEGSVRFGTNNLRKDLAEGRRKHEKPDEKYYDNLYDKYYHEMLDIYKNNTIMMIKHNDVDIDKIEQRYTDV